MACACCQTCEDGDPAYSDSHLRCQPLSPPGPTFNLTTSPPRRTARRRTEVAARRNHETVGDRAIHAGYGLRRWPEPLTVRHSPAGYPRRNPSRAGQDTRVRSRSGPRAPAHSRGREHRGSIISSQIQDVVALVKRHRHSREALEFLACGTRWMEIEASGGDEHVWRDLSASSQPAFLTDCRREAAERAVDARLATLRQAQDKPRPGLRRFILSGRWRRADRA
jgi:hypothetical protein